MATIEEIARICHEINRAYCIAIKDDMEMGPWQDAPEWQKVGVMAGVRMALDNPQLEPAMSHEGWLANKSADGWRYGPVKDPIAKTHPDMVPYKQLPPEQRVKNHLFLAVVRAMSRS